MRLLWFSIFACFSLSSCAFDDAPRVAGVDRPVQGSVRFADSETRANVESEILKNIDPRSKYVVLRLSISETGEVTKVEVYKSNVPKSLEAKAVAAAKSKFRCKPCMVGGVPVPSTLIQPIRFK